MSEIGTARTCWHKSSFSGGDNNCVEVARADASVIVRDSKNPLGGRISFSPVAWQAFTSGLARPSAGRDSVM